MKVVEGSQLQGMMLVGILVVRDLRKADFFFDFLAAFFKKTKSTLAPVCEGMLEMSKTGRQDLSGPKSMAYRLHRCPDKGGLHGQTRNDETDYDGEQGCEDVGEEGRGQKQSD